MEIVQAERSFYKLFRDGLTGEYFLEVECAARAVFTQRITLNAAEIAQCLESRENTRYLAYKISDFPANYRDRRE